MLNQIKEECLACNLCSIGQKKLDGHVSNVFSNMNPSPIVILGQNPGKEEVIQGTPFVGISGKIFDECLLEYAGLTRKDLYICNAVNCLTPNNRKPTEVEFINCSVFLEKQLDFLKPKVVVTLGGLALRVMTGLNGINKYQGKPIYSNKYRVTVFPIFHPSPMNTNIPERKKEFCDSLSALKEYLKEIDLLK